jgi:hypothetical protein
MAVFTIDLYVGYKFFTDNARRDAQAADYAITMGRLEACRIARSLRDDSSPRIVVWAYGLGRAGESVVLAEFTATDRDEIDAASTLVAKRLGSAVAQRAILRVPQEYLLPHDAR